MQLKIWHKTKQKQIHRSQMNENIVHHHHRHHHGLLIEWIKTDLMNGSPKAFNFLWAL